MKNVKEIRCENCGNRLKFLTFKENIDEINKTLKSTIVFKCTKCDFLTRRTVNFRV